MQKKKTTGKKKVKSSKPKKLIRLTKIFQVERYLKSGRKLTSWQAINFWGATRLADIVYQLKNRSKKKLNIETILKEGKDRYGNVSTYASYRLIKTRTKRKKKTDLINVEAV